MKQKRKSLLMIAALGVALSAHAVDRVWNDTSADFNNASSWNTGLPDTANPAAFQADADTNIVNQPNLTDDIAVQQVRFTANSSTNYVLTANAGKKLTLTGVGSTATAGTGAALMANNSVGVNTISAPIVLGAASYSTQYFRVNTTGGTLLVPGNISEANPGITLCAIGSGNAFLRLAGSNSFSGGLIVNTTVLEVGSSNAVPSLGLLSLGNAGTIRSSDLTPRTFANPFELAGTFTFGSGTPAYMGNLIFTNAGTLTADFVTTVPSVNPSPVSAVAFEGPIGESGSRALTVFGSTSGVGYGYLFLLGPNTYSGKTTINTAGTAGPVVINTIGNDGETASSLGAPTGAVRSLYMAAGSSSSSHGNLRYIGGTTSTDRPIVAGNAGTSGATAPTMVTLDASGYGPLTFTAPMTLLGGASTSSRQLNLIGTGQDANTFANTIPNFTTGSSLAVNKNGAGTWVLSGSNGFAGLLTVNAGRLVLDFTNQATVLATANNLSMGGGTLALKAKGGSASAQTLGNLTLTDHSLNRIELAPNGGSMALTLGNTWTRGSGAGLYLDLPAGADLAASPALVNGLLLYAAVEDDAAIGFATTNTSGRVVRYAHAPSQLLTASPGFSNTTNLYLTNSLVMSGGSTMGYTLDVDTGDGGSLDLGGGTRSLNSGAWLFHGAGDFAITNGVVGGGSSASETIMHQYADGDVRIESWGSANNNLAKSGPGTLILGYKSGAGYLRCYEGAVRADHITVLTNYTTTAQRFIILNGGVLELGASGDLSNTLGGASGNLQFLGSGGFSAYGATRTVRLNNGTASLDWGSANFIPANNALLLSGKDANALIDFQNGLGFGNQQRLVRVADGAADVDARLSGVLSGGYGGGLIKDGAGTLEITGAANTYPGETWVRAGTLLANNAGGTATGSGTVLVFSGGAIGGTGSVSRLRLMTGGALRVYGTAGGVGTLRVTGALDITAGTLDFSGLGVLPAGDLVLVECGSLTGTFASVTNLPSGRTLVYTPTSLVLKGSAAGSVILIR
jgi:autotransporter-associated beta strand protein